MTEPLEYPIDEQGNFTGRPRILVGEECRIVIDRVTGAQKLQIFRNMTPGEIAAWDEAHGLVWKRVSYERRDDAKRS